MQEFSSYFDFKIHVQRCINQKYYIASPSLPFEQIAHLYSIQARNQKIIDFYSSHIHFQAVSHLTNAYTGIYEFWSLDQENAILLKMMDPTILVVQLKDFHPLRIYCGNVVMGQRWYLENDQHNDYMRDLY